MGMFSDSRDWVVYARIATLCEMIGYAFQSKISIFKYEAVTSQPVVYVLLNLCGRSIFEFLAHLTVTGLWIRQAAIDMTNPRDVNGQSDNMNVTIGFYISSFSPFLIVFAVTMIGMSIGLAVVAQCRPHPTSLDVILATPLAQLQNLLETICWIQLAIFTAFCGVATCKRILDLEPTPSWQRRLISISRRIAPMTLAFASHLTRATWLFAAYYSNGNKTSASWIRWIGFHWIPTAIASVAAVYSVQYLPSSRVDRSISSQDDHGDTDHSSFQMLDQPSEDIFEVMFYREVEESFFWSTPVPHVYVRSSPFETLDDIETGFLYINDESSDLTSDTFSRSGSAEFSQSALS
jgi:hypothetical protein